MKLKELFTENFHGKPNRTWFPSLKNGIIDPIKNTSYLDYWNDDAKIDDVDIIDLHGCPKIVEGDLLISLCTRLTSLEGAPQEVKGNVKINYCPKITSLGGIGQKYLTSIHGKLSISKTITSDILGILKIQNLTDVSLWALGGNILQAINIINKHLHSGKNINKCRAELEDAGLEEYAQL